MQMNDMTGRLCAARAATPGREQWMEAWSMAFQYLPHTHMTCSRTAPGLGLHVHDKWYQGSRGKLGPALGPPCI
jgi:hypothetical protein